MGEGFPVAKMQGFIPNPLFSFLVAGFTPGAFGFLCLKAWVSFSRLFKYLPSLPFPSHCFKLEEGTFIHVQAGRRFV